MVRGGSKLKQRLSQNLSTWQIQVMGMVALPHAELAERVKQELIENPALEEGKEIDPEDQQLEPTSDLSAEEMEMGDYADIDDVPEPTLRRYYEGQSVASEIPFSEEQSLQEHLLEQLPLTPLDEDEQKIARFIIGSLDEDGYLRRTLEGVSDDLAIYQGIEVEISELEKILKVIQELDPAGVGANSLQECLWLQLDRREKSPEVELALEIVQDYFDLFGRKQLDRLKEAVDASDEELRGATHLITTLNPTPGLDFSTKLHDTLMSVIPDFEVTEREGDLVVTLNNGGIPEVRVSKTFEQQMEGYKGEVNRFVKEKVESARSFVEMLKQRNNTLISTMMAIVELQRDYFLSGDISLLKPMILQDVADITGYDPSTISRVTNSKYAQTDFGIYSLKHFFSDGFIKDDGEEVTTHHLKDVMQRIIDEEDKREPLSDDALKDALQEEGFTIARRTVAKYRDSMNIPVARLRKEW